MKASWLATRRGRMMPGALVALVLLHFAIVGYGLVLDNTDSNGGDQGEFLLMGLDIRAGAALTDGNRQPLFPLLIAPFAERTWRYYTLAKLVSLAAGTASLAAIYFLGRRIAGGWTALAALALFSANGEFLAQTPQVLCEALLVGASFVCFAACVAALERPDSWRAGLAASAATALVYWTKGTGMLFVIAFALAALIVARRKVLRAPLLWAYLIGFIALASPLFIYNVTRYGSPLYNFNSTHAFWFASWDDRYLAPEQWPTMASYLASQTLGQMIQRLAGGVVTIIPVIAEAFALRGLPLTGWAFLVGAAGVMGWGLYQAIPSPLPLSQRGKALDGFDSLSLWERERQRSRRGVRVSWLLAALWMLLFFLFFAWFAPVTDAPRFFLPLTPILYLLLARALAVGWVRMGRRAWWLEPLRNLGGGALAVGLVAWCIVGGVRAWGLPDWAHPFARDARVNREADLVATWLNRRAGKGLRVLWGPSHTLPKWKVLPQVTFEPLPSDAATWEDIERFIAEKHMQYAVLEDKMYKRRKDVLQSYIDKNGKELLFTALPAGWTFAHVQRSEDTNWYVLALGEESTAPVTPLEGAHFGQNIALTGWAVQPAAIAPDEPLEVTLVWQADDPSAEDWTVFVHLLDPAGNRVAQADSYPLGGMYATSHWRAGEAVRDRYTLVPGGDLASGEYQLAIGFYNLKDKARLPVSGGATTSNGEALLLPAGAKP